jgi:predicted DNA-binding transcriptional regulator YafY
MNRLDRALGILLLLRQGETVSAAELAQRFEVSVRTIYRDIEALSELGVPVYAEMGRSGGFRLMEGYFLPPVMLKTGEAASLLLGLTLLRRLRVTPFPEELATAEHKLLAVLPDHLRNVLAQAAHLIGFEDLPLDIFHWAASDAAVPTAGTAEMKAKESLAVNTFLRALLEGKHVHMRYRSPYRSEERAYRVAPAGLVWDRDWWYLVGKIVESKEEVRLWRADRVLSIAAQPAYNRQRAEFDVNQLLGRTWLQAAMAEWTKNSPVKLRITAQQAAWLKLDWYYRHARYEELGNGRVLMTFGEDKAEFVLDLVRWLGPGAELVEPQAWRSLLRAELQALLDAH